MKELTKYIIEKLKVDKTVNINDNKKYDPITPTDRKELVDAQEIVVEYLADNRFFGSPKYFSVGKSDDDILILWVDKRKHSLINKISSDLCKKLDCAAGIDEEKGIIEFIV